MFHLLMSSNLDLKKKGGWEHVLDNKQKVWQVHSFSDGKHRQYNPYGEKYQLIQEIAYRRCMKNPLVKISPAKHLRLPAVVVCSIQALYSFLFSPTL